MQIGREKERTVPKWLYTCSLHVEKEKKKRFQRTDKEVDSGDSSAQNFINFDVVQKRGEDVRNKISAKGGRSTRNILFKETFDPNKEEEKKTRGI